MAAVTALADHKICALSHGVLEKTLNNYLVNTK